MRLLLVEGADVYLRDHLLANQPPQPAKLLPKGAHGGGLSGWRRQQPNGPVICP